MHLEELYLRLRGAETRSEGMRLEAPRHHLGSGDSAGPIDYGDKKKFIYGLIAFALVALFFVFILVVLPVL